MNERFDGTTVLRTPILDVLRYFQANGYPSIDTTVYSCSGKDLKLRSPFRDERTASFDIMTDSNCWKDFGSGESGGVLDLVVRFAGPQLDTIQTKDGSQRSKALVFLSRIIPDPGVCRDFTPVKTSTRGMNARSLEVTNVLAVFTDDPLVRYAGSRGISKELLERYCYQITYHSRFAPDSYHTNIGFPNIGRGYAYRGPGERDKGCTSSQVSIINSKGKFDTEPSCSSVICFEGFFDFLSYMQYKHDLAVSGAGGFSGEQVDNIVNYVPVSDVVVLNSVNNIGCALDYLRGHDVVNCCFDNDRAGQECYNKVIKAMPAHRVYDRSGLYDPYNDFNEFLMTVKAEDVGYKKKI